MIVQAHMKENCSPNKEAKTFIQLPELLLLWSPIVHEH